MSNARTAFIKRRWYRLNKLRKAMENANMEVEKGYHCISVIVWKHPRPSRARIGDTVSQSLSINWTDHDGYIWYPNLEGTSPFTTFSIREVLRTFKAYINTDAYAEVHV